ncbi:MAG: MgtC/SapB family protein [Peptococcaceae bacterium]|nr:MgtC/SapB family protein [Peptococcaceae bacterium]
MLFSFDYGEIFQYELVFMFRLLLAMLLGGIIGAERERKNRSAGFRTHILVTVGSCMFMIVSISMPMMISTMPNGIVNNADPGRIAAQVVSGIGFLGAGAIIQDKGKVRGLTTAASLWVVAAIGLAVGAGMYLTAISTTFFLFLILSVFAKLEEKTMRKTKAKAEKKRHHEEMEEVILCMENAEDDSIDLKCIE